MNFTVVFHDGKDLGTNSLEVALTQAYLDSCSTFFPVDVLCEGRVIATVQAKP